MSSYKYFPNAKILDNANFDFANSMVIKPPFADDAKTLNPEMEIKYTRVVVDSRDRDMKIYPSPCSYVMELETDIPEVTSAQVIITELPVANIFLINAFNNVFVCRIGLQSETIQIPIGNYSTPASMTQALISALPDQFEVISNPASSILTITYISSFSLSFPSKSDIAGILGFIGGSTVNSVGNSIQAPFTMNLQPNRYVIMSVDQLNVNNSMNSVLHQSTALISIDQWKHLNLNPIKKTLNPPIARLTKLIINFTDYYGNPCDFQNQDHRLEFLFESKKHLSKYTAFV